jgi:hypothetical protein
MPKKKSIEIEALSDRDASIFFIELVRNMRATKKALDKVGVNNKRHRKHSKLTRDLNRWEIMVDDNAYRLEDMLSKGDTEAERLLGGIITKGKIASADIASRSGKTVMIETPEQLASVFPSLAIKREGTLTEEVKKQKAIDRGMPTDFIDKRFLETQ